LVRKITFDGGAERSHEPSAHLISKVETQLRLNGAREWQIEKCAEALALSLRESELPAIEEATSESTQGEIKGSENLPIE
jgi:hypothetical protein